VLRRSHCAGGLLLAGAALLLTAVAARADEHCDQCDHSNDSCFTFFRRCPADAGSHATTILQMYHRYCPPRCPPYCDPTFGFYPTAWRSWPSLCSAVGDELETGPAPKTTGPGGATPAPGGAAPQTMPPAEGGARRPMTPGVLPTVRTTGQVYPVTGASVR
jgi:hypothetical protein